MVAPALCDLKWVLPFPASYNFIARSATCNCGKDKHFVLIERNSSVQSGGFLRAQALKFPFFLVSFSFENERKRNSARSAETVCKDTKVRLPYRTDVLSEEGRLEYARRRVGNNSAGDRWSPLLCVI